MTIALASETPISVDNAVSLYVDCGKGYEFLTKLYFEKGVTEQAVEIKNKIQKIRVVKGDCYELDLDRLALNGVCPKGFEKNYWLQIMTC